MSRSRTILAFDYGARRIGVAVGNTITRTARPLRTVSEPVVARRFGRIGELLTEWHPDALVVGRPVHPDGTPSAAYLRSGGTPSAWHASSWCRRRTPSLSTTRS